MIKGGILISLLLTLLAGMVFAFFLFYKLFEL